MWPFSPKPKELSALPGISDASHHWGIAKAEYGGSPLLIRFNKSAEEWVGNAGLPIKLGFAIPLNLPNENGLPDPDENQQLNDVEDVILREVEAGTKGIHVLALTNGMMKEFVFYIPRGADIQRIHEMIQESVSTHDVQCMALEEPEWDSYRQFTSAE
ncbi:MAG: DUF695 domain-containing protein [Planctomycetales bacterium]|nr:DUF695 domain-containing protein [Planctomycetales bacterium]